MRGVRKKVTLTGVRDAERRHSSLIIGNYRPWNHKERCRRYQLRDFEAPAEDKLAVVSASYALTMQSKPAQLLTSMSVSYPDF